MNLPEKGFRLERGVAIFTCTRCAKELTLPLSKPNLPSEAIAIFGRKKGWVVSPIRKQICLCPECKIAPPSPNDPDSEIKKHMEKMPPATAAPSHYATDVAAPTATAVAIPALPESLAYRPDPQPSQEQRLAIRAALDRNFNDADGCYINGMSDAAIAEHIGVPRIVVERIREAAYGPIRKNPAVDALLTEVAALRTMIDDLERRIKELKP